MEMSKQAKKIFTCWILPVICSELFLKYQLRKNNQLNKKVIPPKQNIMVIVLELIKLFL
tara:strand:+ start:202 stop:378 length:177 start_codon:yes stop_codon:yes gene_type:complete